MSVRRIAVLVSCLTLATLSLFGTQSAFAADESGPPQPEAVVMTRLCEQNGALVAMNNFGGGSVTFNVLVDNEASGTYTVSAGATANHLVPVMEDQTVAIQVTADGMAPVAATRTRDCDAAAPAAADATTGATDPVDAVPAGTPAPQPVQPTAVAGASDTPAESSATPADPTIAPADSAAPTGTLPFTGTASIAWIAGLGMALVFAGALTWRPRRMPVRTRRS